MNTLKRHDEQVNKALIFTGRVGFTNAENIQIAADRNRRGFPTQLKKMGLLLSRDMGRGLTIFGLSKAGADRVGMPQIDIHKITWGRVDHAIIGQFETLQAIKEHGVVDYLIEPQEHAKDTRPDIIWIWCDGAKIFIEVELSGKSISDGDLDRFFLKLLSRKTIVIFKDESLKNRYFNHAREYIKNGIPDWQKVEGRWVKCDRLLEFEYQDWRNIYFQLHKDKGYKLGLGAIYQGVMGNY